jgi:Glycosyltransferases, probably involved in cell wall biogenesis
MKKDISISVIIPTYKPDDIFLELLEKLSKQSQSIEKIVIINTIAGEFPESQVKSYENVEVHHIKEEDFNHGASRNLGASFCDTDIIAFMTQDAKPRDDKLIENLIKSLANDIDKESECVAASYARQLPTSDCNFIESYTRSFNYGEVSMIKSREDLEQMGIKTFFCSNVCAAYRRDIWVKRGGFVNRTIFNEDMIYAGFLINDNYKIAYEASAVVIHSHNYTNIQQFKRNFDLAVSQTDYPEVFLDISSEGEGIKLVKRTIMYLTSEKKAYLIPMLIITSAFKYIGYFLGKRYKKLPLRLILACTMSRRYWKN